MKHYTLPELVETDMEGYLEADPDAEETAYSLDGEEAGDEGRE